MSLDEAQEAAPDAVWSPKLQQDDEGMLARQQVEERAKAKRAKEEEEARREAERAEAERLYNLEHEQSRLRETIATSFASRSAVFLICVLVGIVLFLLAITNAAFERLSTLQLIIFILAAIAAFINLILGVLWCNNVSWGRSRELLCCVPCVCDEREADDGDYEEEDFYDEEAKP